LKKSSNLRSGPDVLILSHEYFPVLSGGSTYLNRLAAALTSIGTEVELVVPTINSKANSFKNTDGNFKVYRVQTFRRRIRDATLFTHFLFTLCSIPALGFIVARRKPKAILAFFALPSGIATFISHAVFRIPFYIFIDAADTPGFDSRSASAARFLKPIYKFLVEAANGVVIVEGIENEVLHLTKPKKYLIIKPGAIDVKCKATPGNRNVTKFLTIGRLVPRKGFLEILQAFALAREVEGDIFLTIVGYGDLEKELKRMVFDFNLQDSVDLKGRVETNDLSTLYLDSDCYIFFGNREGSSVAMMDAMSYGLPILASNFSENQEYVLEGMNGYLIDYPSVSSLALGMVQIIRKKANLSTFGAVSSEIVKPLSWTIIARQYAEFFQK
jgi:glycosyltransferase involved in cell wall biosynthesis